MSTSSALVAVLVLMFSLPIWGQTEKKSSPSAASQSLIGSKSKPDYAERFSNNCYACHGSNGRSNMEGVPVLAGQPSLYAITQLFLYREQRRKNPLMMAIAKEMSDADLRGYSDYIGTLPSVAAPPPNAPLDGERMHRGASLANEYRCNFCHGLDLAGGAQVPRIGGQKQDYLQKTLHDFKDGIRPGYTRAMMEALSQVPADVLDDLAYYAANFEK